MEKILAVGHYAGSYVNRRALPHSANGSPPSRAELWPSFVHLSNGPAMEIRKAAVDLKLFEQSDSYYVRFNMRLKTNSFNSAGEQKIFSLVGNNGQTLITFNVSYYSDTVNNFYTFKCKTSQHEVEIPVSVNTDFILDFRAESNIYSVRINEGSTIILPSFQGLLDRISFGDETQYNVHEGSYYYVIVGRDPLTGHIVETYHAEDYSSTSSAFYKTTSTPPFTPFLSGPSASNVEYGYPGDQAYVFPAIHGQRPVKAQVFNFNMKDAIKHKIDVIENVISTVKHVHPVEGVLGVENYSVLLNNLMDGTTEYGIRVGDK